MRLDRICKELGRSSQETLQALDACRDHRQGRDIPPGRWQTANRLVRSHVNFPFLTFQDLDWLAEMAHAEKTTKPRRGRAAPRKR